MLCKLDQSNSTDIVTFILYFSSYVLLISQQSTENRIKRSQASSSCSKDSINHDYTKSKELGTRCYTTAEIPADLVREEYTFNVGDGEIYSGYLNVPLQQGVNYDLHIVVKVDLPVRYFYK